MPKSLSTTIPQDRWLTCLLLFVSTFVIIWAWYRDEWWLVVLGLGLHLWLILHLTLRSKLMDGLWLAILLLVLWLYPAWQVYIYEVGNSRTRAIHLHTITDAILSYSKDHGQLPKASIDLQDGKPLLSWRVRLLPYLGEENLFQQFKLDETWNSEHNLKLLPHIPKLFQPVAQRVPPGFTRIVVLRGPGSIFDEANPPTLEQVEAADGRSRTVLLAETGRLIPWTQPDDEVVRPEIPAPWLRGYRSSNYTYLSFLDGRVVHMYDQVYEGGLVTFDSRKLHSCITWKGNDSFRDIQEPSDLAP